MESQQRNISLKLHIKTDRFNIYRTFHPGTGTIAILFKCARNILKDRSYLGQKMSPNKCKKKNHIKYFFCINCMKVEINDEKKAGKITNMWNLNNMLLNNYWVKEEVKEEIKRYIDINKNENMTSPKSFRYSKRGAKRKVHSNIGLSQETRKI